MSSWLLICDCLSSTKFLIFFLFDLECILSFFLICISFLWAFLHFCTLAFVGFRFSKETFSCFFYSYHIFIANISTGK